MESVFIVTGQHVQESQVDALLPLAKAEMKWDADALKFRSKLLWNEDREEWMLLQHLVSKLSLKPTSQQSI